MLTPTCSSNWLFNFAIAYATPPLFASLGAGYYFVIVGFVVISFFLVLFLYPETAHHTLEELGEVFGDTSFLKKDNTQGEGEFSVNRKAEGSMPSALFVGRVEPRASFMTERTIAMSEMDGKSSLADEVKQVEA